MSDRPLTAAEGAALLGAPQQTPKYRPVAVPAYRPTAKATRRTFRTSEQHEQDIADRFANDTAQHQLAVLHDDGLYRHLRLRQPDRNTWWFDVITWPGCLTIRGDFGDAYTFTRLPDMFEFFRSKSGRINPHYWSQKLDGHRQTATTYSEKVFRQIVRELFVAAVRYDDAPRGLGKAVRADILDQDLFDESEARKLLESFEYKGFTFGETWEFSFRDYERDFLWACHAIVWGIARYDRVTRYGLSALAAPAEVTA